MRLLSLIIASLIAGIPVTSKAFDPVSAANPRVDDYEKAGYCLDTSRWGTYNVHDPSCRKVGDYYYMYSTDAVYFPRPQRHADEEGDSPEARRKRAERREQMMKERPKMGFLQMRRSKDMVNWEFLGWAFDSIPAEGAEWVKSVNNGRGPGNIWAPYMIPAPDGKSFRLYYCVSAFGKKTSAISMAEAPSPEGPWVHKGIVVKTDSNSRMNAIDPSVIAAPDGRMWMHYGSYFGGLFCVELDPATGFTLKEGDQGHLVARRANYRKDNLEAPEIMFRPETGEYYFFGSYDPLATTYNVRVGRGNKAEGPFIDFFGKELADTTNNFPILTAPYRFEGHPGWVGTAHCGVWNDGQGNWFMAHQGRLAPHNQMLDLHVRQMFFTEDGWPVVSPERYAGTPAREFAADDMEGDWEIIRINEPLAERQLEAGQIMWGEGALLNGEWNLSQPLTLLGGGKADGSLTHWEFDAAKQLLTLGDGNETISNLIVFAGHDWEREQDTVLFTGLDSRGRSVWGKRIK